MVAVAQTATVTRANPDGLSFMVSSKLFTDDIETAKALLDYISAGTRGRITIP
jgi:hypothetical protein